jgi:hypothetical protein
MDIQTVIDKQAIHDLQVRYSWALDRNDYDDLDYVFTPDVVADYAHAGQHTNVEQVKQACHDALVELDSSHHQNGNHWADIDGDSATAGCYFRVHLFRSNAPGGDYLRMGGRYEDKVMRTAEGWRIYHRSISIDWSEGNPNVRSFAVD